MRLSVRVVRGQPISAGKLALAKRLRQQMTESEGVLWSSLRRNQLAGLHFRRQQMIAGFVVDFYCHSARLVVEIDGDAHSGQSDYDAERDGVLAGIGLTILRVAADEVESDLASVLERIARACAAALPQAPSPPWKRS